MVVVHPQTKPARYYVFQYSHMTQFNQSKSTQTYLRLGGSNGLRESKERQSEVDEAVLVALQLPVAIGNLQGTNIHR